MQNQILFSFFTQSLMLRTFKLSVFRWQASIFIHVFIIGSCMSCVLAVIGGMNEPSLTADLSKYNRSAIKALTVVIIAGSVAVLLLDVFGMYIVCTYGSYFRVQINQRGRAAVIRFNQGPDGTMVVTSQTTSGYNSGWNTANMGMGNSMFRNMGGQPTAFSKGGAADVHSLQEQNRLLQEQVRLQQQLLNQQQQQQLLQAGQFGYSMPPPAPGFAPSPPDAPPPSYHEVKRY